MSALLDSLTHIDATGSGDPHDAALRSQLGAVRAAGLPGLRSEAWKYTSLRALERRSFARVDADADADVDGSGAPAAIDAMTDALPAGASLATLLDGIPAPRLVYVNGRLHRGASDLDGLPDGVTFVDGAAPGESCNAAVGIADAGAPRADDVFARLNSSLATHGAVLRVADGVRLEQPLHLVCIGAPAAADVAWHLAHHVELGAGAHATLVEHQLARGPHAHLANTRMRIALQAGAQLWHARVQDDANGATQLLRTDATLADDALYQRVDLELGSNLSRHELNVQLRGDRARVVANGVLPADGRRHLDTRLQIDHHGRDTACALLWRGVADARGRVVFHGGITIHPGADGSDATLSNKNLLLTEGAQVDTQPVLVIHADEVKAAHGATVGQLDPTALFYLRSRGLPEADARRLLTTAFVREPLDGIADATLRAALQLRLDGALRGLAQA